MTTADFCRAAPIRKIVLGAFVFMLTATCIALADAPPIGPDEGRPRVQWPDAAKVVGRVAYVTGQIVDVGHTQSVHFLNFGKGGERDNFKIVVHDRHLREFPDKLEQMYLDKYVSVRGIVTLYGGKPQIQAASPSQIEILAEAPQTPRFAEPAPVVISDTITIASYNIRNLFDAEDSPYYNDETTPAKPRGELEPLAAVLRDMNADVIALQETETRGYLERFIEVFLADMGYRNVVHVEGNDDRNTNVALISRLPIGPVTSHRHHSFTGPDGVVRRFERDVIQVRVEPDGGDPFDVWVVHLKSNFDGKAAAEPVRVAEATEVRRLIDESLARDPRARFVVCGDFNDVADSPAVKTVMGSGDTALRFFGSTLPEDGRVTYNRQPYLSMIDFILFSPGMAEQFVDGSYAIRSGEKELSASDHNPVLARFRVRSSEKRSGDQPAAMTGKSQ